MKTLSYIIDLAVFFTLIGAFEVNWFIALIISELVGAGIRAMFASEKANSVQAKSD